MRNTSRLLAFLFFLPGVAINAQSPPDPGKLPVKRVVLYKNGVGYFEHLGHVRDSQDVTISFTSGQLNDVLKSLTVLDLSGGRITGVTYGSAAPLERQLGELNIPVGEKPTLTEFLGSLRGARLEVRNGPTPITGRLLSVERKTRIAGGTTLEVDYLSLVTETGEVRTAELSPAFSVRLLDRDLTIRVGRFLDLVSSVRDSSLRRMVISTAGTGERPLFVSYISEVPVWKATYRIVLSPKPDQPPLVQGWAIVDNTVGQDWENVELSLVAGAPQSFIQNLSQPYYSRRPTVPLPEAAMTSPQTFESTLVAGGQRLMGRVTDATGAPVPGAQVRVMDANGNVAGRTTTDGSGVYTFDSLVDGTFRIEIEAAGFNRFVRTDVAVSGGKVNVADAALQVGSQAESVKVTRKDVAMIRESELPAPASRTTGTGSALGSNRPRQFDAGRLVVPRGGGFGGGTYTIPAAATAQELGDLFEYKVKEPITIRKNQSAMVPIVHSPITVEKVSVWNAKSGWPRPQRALWLTNSTGLTLDGGSFSVLEQETFAGEGIFEPIRPAEKRLVSYAIDLALTTSARDTSEPQRVSRVRVNKGIITHSSEVRDKKTYTFRNSDTSPRTVIVEHAVRPGYELRGDVHPVETSAGWMRFRVEVKPKETASLVVEEARPLEATYALTNLTSDQVSLFVRERTVSPALEAALRSILAQKGVVSDLEARKEALDTEQGKIYDDQQRLRENMKVLKGSPDEKALLQRYTQQLNQQENRLEAIGKETGELEKKQEAAQAELDRMIQELAFDEKT